MPEPVIYDAAAEALKANTAFLKDYTPPANRPEERDAIWNFEQLPGMIQEQTDLRAWKQKTKDVRMALVKAWTSDLSKRGDEDPTALSLRRMKLRRKLLFVIVTEADSVRGSREVAAEAFKAVFPKE